MMKNISVKAILYAGPNRYIGGRNMPVFEASGELKMCPDLLDLLMTDCGVTFKGVYCRKVAGRAYNPRTNTLELRGDIIDTVPIYLYSLVDCGWEAIEAGLKHHKINFHMARRKIKRK